MKKEISLHPALTGNDLETMCTRYHFRNEDLPQLGHMYRALEPLLAVAVWIEVNPELSFLKGDERVICMVTLGKYVDSLENLYSEAGAVSEAYRIDCLCLELLSKSYKQVEELLHKESGLWPRSYAFMGDQYPIERTADIVDYFGQEKVTYNSAFMMIPKKSVVFAAELTEKRERHCCHICISCSNQACVNRSTKEQEAVPQHLTYGYQRILG